MSTAAARVAVGEGVGGPGGLDDRDVAGFDATFDGLLARAWTLAEKIVGDPILADDLATEALARLCADWKRAGAHRPDAVLARHVVQLAIGAVARREPLGITTAGAPLGSEPLLRHDEARALAALPRRRREVVGLWFFAQLGKRDIATLLHVKPKTVDAELARARASLRAALGVDVMADASS